LMRKVSPRQARRMMQQMGMRMEELEGVVEVVLRTGDKEIVVENPSVAVMEIQGQKMFQVSGERVVEKPLKAEVKGVEVRAEDAQLLAMQLNVSLDEARKALEASNGNLAEALLLLQSRRGK